MQFGLTLVDEDEKKFNNLQKKLGIHNKSEVIRFAINFTLEHYNPFNKKAED